jgi:hypothetical protein
VNFISPIIKILNLNKNINIDQFSNEIFINFNLNKFFKIVSDPEHEYYDLEIKQKFYQQKISDVIIYAQLHIKFRYDKSHKPFLLNISDTAFLNLHQSYRISGIHNRKLAQQRIEFFRMIYRVSPLIYEFEFPNNIYSVISVTYLESVSKDSDFYNHSYNDYPAPIKKDL